MNKKVMSFILLLVLGFSACGKNHVEYDFKVNFGDYEDKAYINEKLEEYSSETGIYVQAVYNDESVAVATVTEGAYSGFNEMGVKGYGLAFDKRLATELVGEANSEAFIEDMIEANHAEWTLLVAALNQYISHGGGGSVTLNGNEYTFIDKGTLTSELNGVYAVAGASSSEFGDNILNIAFQDVSFAAIGTTPEALRPILTNYVNLLDLMTSNMAGLYGSAIRGDDFTTSYYKLEAAEKIFMNGRAVFLPIDSSEAERLRELNANKFEHLTYIPLKISDSSAVPAMVDYSFGLKEGVEDSKVEEFVAWYCEQYEENNDPLSKSLITYVASDSLLQYDIEDENFEDWKDSVLASDEVEDYLSRPSWSEEDKTTFVQFMIDNWDK